MRSLLIPRPKTHYILRRETTVITIASDNGRERQLSMRFVCTSPCETIRLLCKASAHNETNANIVSVPTKEYRGITKLRNASSSFSRSNLREQTNHYVKTNIGKQRDTKAAPLFSARAGNSQARPGRIICKRRGSVFACHYVGRLDSFFPYREAPEFRRAKDARVSEDPLTNGSVGG